MRGLDRLISIERKTITQDAAGQEVEAWEAIDASRPAVVLPVRGEERFVSQQFIARQQTEFRVRWSSNVADLTPLDRIIYPAGSTSASGGDFFGNAYFGVRYFGPRFFGSSDESEVSSADESEIYDIIEVVEVDRRRWLKIIGARRPDA
jgi:head-tail adaptor